MRTLKELYEDIVCEKNALAFFEEPDWIKSVKKDRKKEWARNLEWAGSKEKRIKELKTDITKYYKKRANGGKSSPTHGDTVGWAIDGVEYTELTGEKFIDPFAVKPKKKTKRKKKK